MSAFKLNLKIDQGATFTKAVTWKNGVPATLVNLNGCTARMQVRSSVESLKIILELNTENGGIILGGVAGTVTLVIPASLTKALTATAHNAVYDLEIVFPNGTIRRLLAGTVTISPEVTR